MDHPRFTCPTQESEQQSPERSWFERRQAQSNAAQKHRNRKREITRPGKGNRNNWKRDEE